MKKILLLFCLVSFLGACRQDKTPSIDYDLDANNIQLKDTRTVIKITNPDSSESK